MADERGATHRQAGREIMAKLTELCTTKRGDLFGWRVARGDETLAESDCRYKYRANAWRFGMREVNKLGIRLSTYGEWWRENGPRLYAELLEVARLPSPLWGLLNRKGDGPDK
jgi:hypothetical protein